MKKLSQRMSSSPGDLGQSSASSSRRLMMWRIFSGGLIMRKERSAVLHGVLAPSDLGLPWKMEVAGTWLLLCLFSPACPQSPRGSSRGRAGWSRGRGPAWRHSWPGRGGESQERPSPLECSWPGLPASLGEDSTSRNHKLRLLLMWQGRHIWPARPISGSLV